MSAPREPTPETPGEVADELRALAVAATCIGGPRATPETIVRGKVDLACRLWRLAERVERGGGR